MHWALVPGGAGRLAEDAHVLLERRDQVRHDLEGNGNLRPDRRTNDVLGLGLAMSFSERGSTSQKDSVKSNGV